ncbi:MAG: hypothetical protein M3320_02015, partial [Actinomycetota bacterium]|nr:hypothetical protein [Actinomycetota bacterium]MDQ5807429.1 hypothetical protein [Actinomycetota bacterium]
MSYIARPRIGFHGTDMMTNPSTGNNENVIHLLDPNNVELLNPPAMEGAELEPMSDVAYREWMTSLMTSGNPPDPAHPTADPEWSPAMPGYWNYYGDHLTTFGSAAVNSVWIEDDIGAGSGDPLIGARIAFNAKLVDLDPADTFCSQLIAANFSVIWHDAHGELVELLGGVPTTSSTHWLNFNRYAGAGTFQCVIPNDALRFVDPASAPDSPGLAALREGAASGGGLMLRWCMYGLTAGKQMTEMYDRFQNGEFPFNPKVGSVLGTIGVWNGTDMTTAPVGRILQQPGPPFESPPKTAAPAPPPVEVVKTHGDVERVAAQGPPADEAKYAGLMGPA